MEIYFTIIVCVAMFVTCSCSYSSKTDKHIEKKVGENSTETVLTKIMEWHFSGRFRFF